MSLGDALGFLLIFGIPVVWGLRTWYLQKRRDEAQLAKDDPVPDAHGIVGSDGAEHDTYRCGFDWKALGGELGLKHVPPGGGSGGHLLLGSTGSLKVSISELALTDGPDRDESAGVAIEVDSKGRIPAGVALRAEERLDVVRKTVQGEDLLVGDEEFDSQAHVQGPEDAVLAALREPARRALLPLLTGHRATVTDGVLRVELCGDVDAEMVKRMLAGMSATAQALFVPSVPDALAEGAQADSHPEVRLKSLEALLRSWREHEAAKRAGLAAIIDANPRARLAAARLLADEQAALALKALADDGAVPAEVRIGALETLLELRPEFLGESLRRWASSDESLAAPAARALGTIGDAGAEQVLIALLAHPVAGARAAAVESLGVVGTIRAVEPLTALLSDRAHREHAQSAIRQIQSKLGDVGAGRLSVVVEQGESGALSLSDRDESALDAPERVKS
ncbi:MAG: HEAT repeat domain-containing protein [Myxococcales bacterium]